MPLTRPNYVGDVKNGLVYFMLIQMCLLYQRLAGTVNTWSAASPHYCKRELNASSEEILNINEENIMAAKPNLVGSIFGELLVLSETNKRQSGKVLWLCECKCGSMVLVSTNNLNSGGSTSCGCLRLESITKHGLHGSGIYKVWASMKHRCSSKNSSSWEDYGGRGITYCSSWELFENFYNDMGDTYREGLSIGRVDNDGPYCKENCRWETPLEQIFNRRVNKNKLSKYRGVTLDRRANKYVARVTLSGRKCKYLGSYESEIEAAKVYDEYVIDNNLPNKLNFDDKDI